MMQEVTMTRVYLKENEVLLEKVGEYLKAAKIRGYSVFKGIIGRGSSGENSNRLLNLSLGQSLVIEFFDSPNRIREVIHELQKIIKPEHIVTWAADIH